MRRQQTAAAVVAVSRELTDDDLGVIVEAAQRRAALVSDMRRALETGDDAVALRLARRVCGLEQQAIEH